jgi:hypothetical protein
MMRDALLWVALGEELVTLATSFELYRMVDKKQFTSDDQLRANVGL